MARRKNLHFRAFEEEEKLLIILAKRERVTVSALMRDLIRAEAKRQGLLPAGLISLQEVIDKGGEDGNQ